MGPVRRTRSIVASLLVALCLPTSASTETALPPNPIIEKAPMAPTLDPDEAGQRYFSDLPLLTQEGKRVRFFSDLLQDHVVLIHFIFTHCTSACPILVRTVAEVQKRLGDLLGDRVRLLSISVDPERDTPAVLEQYAARVEARAGWFFLTGEKKNVDWVIYKLGQYEPEFEAHSPLFLLGNLKTGHWQKLRGDATPEQLASQLRALAAEG